ncbi:MAG: hypothetical protein QJR02_07375 [Sinobacteraceae bacterium]|nr:hypothetical protein [Nevskiaceae bacterium]
MFGALAGFLVGVLVGITITALRIEAVERRSNAQNVQLDARVSARQGSEHGA